MYVHLSLYPRVHSQDVKFLFCNLNRFDHAERKSTFTPYTLAANERIYLKRECHFVMGCLTYWSVKTRGTWMEKCTHKQTNRSDWSKLNAFQAILCFLAITFVGRARKRYWISRGIWLIMFAKYKAKIKMQICRKLPLWINPTYDSMSDKYERTHINSKIF